VGLIRSIINGPAFLQTSSKLRLVARYARSYRRWSCERMIYAAFDFKESISRDSSRMRVNARVYCQERNLPLFLMLLSLEVELGNPETRSVYCYYYSNAMRRDRAWNWFREKKRRSGEQSRRTIRPPELRNNETSSMAGIVLASRIATRDFVYACSNSRRF